MADGPSFCVASKRAWSSGFNEPLRCITADRAPTCPAASPKNAAARLCCSRNSSRRSRSCQRIRPNARRERKQQSFVQDFDHRSPPYRPPPCRSPRARQHLGQTMTVAGPGMKTRTRFTHRIDMWDDAGENIIEHLAGVSVPASAPLPPS
jgi:hypothetical protein